MNEPTTAGIIFLTAFTVLALRALGKFLEVYPTDVHQEKPRKLPRSKRRPVSAVREVQQPTRSGFEYFFEEHETW